MDIADRPTDLFSLFMSLAIQKQQGGDDQIIAKLEKDPSLLGKTFSQLEEDDPHRSDINVLHVACQEGLVETTEFILQKRADLIHGKSQAQWTPLMNACERGQLEVIEVLLEFDIQQLKFKSENGMPLHSAISGKQPVTTVEFLIQFLREKEPDSLIQFLNSPDESGVTPLFLAVYTGNVDVCNALIEAGADPMQSTQKVSPLHICAERGFHDISLALLTRSPELVKSVDEQGNTALHVACDWDQLKTIQYICEAGTRAVIEAVNKEGKTPVEIAYEANT